MSGMITKTGRWSHPIKWHGGKTYLAANIIKMMPPHIHYVEPFFGGGAVFFQKPQSLIDDHSEVINDLYAELMVFWEVLRSEDKFSEFQRKALMTPFAKPIWEQSIDNVETLDLVDRALAFFIRYRQSRQGLGRDFATMSRNRKRRGMNEQVSSWLSAIEGLPEAHERLRRVAIFCDDACHIIQREDGINTLFYCDPPYLTGTRTSKDTYSFEMTDVEHDRLLTILGGIRGKFLLSGYRNDLYDAAAERFGWSRKDFTIDNKASSKKTKPLKVECVWAND